MTPFVSWRLIHLFAAFLCMAAHVSAESVEALIKRGDADAAKFRSELALQSYLAAEKVAPKDPEVLVRISRQYRHLMSDARSEDEKRAFGNKAVHYARTAVEIAPNDADAQLALAISLGKLLPLQGNRERMEGSREIKEAADKAIKLDPRNDLGWHILGRWNLLLAEIGPLRRAIAQLVYGRLPHATNEAAVKSFQRAISLNPGRLMHYIELGRTYAQMGRKKEARAYIERGLAMRDTEKDDPETKQRGRDILKKL